MPSSLASNPFAQAQAADVEAPSLPLLDLRDYSQGSAAQRARFIQRLRETAHGPGFFYLRGHGLGEADVARLFKTAREFFNLPREQKLALRMAHSPHFRGYTAAGEEITQGERDWREQLDIGAERAPLAGALLGPPEQAWRRLQGPNQWPAELPQLQSVLLNWQDRLSEVAQQLLQALALALQQRHDRFDAAFAQEPVQHLKLIRYPGIAADKQSQQGVGAHKDSGCLSLLQQDRQGGLQVLLPSQAPGQPARWMDVPPLPGTLVVNLGEVLEILSGGFLRATVHRVISPPQGADRLSLAFFLGPRLDAELAALDLPPALAAQARGLTLAPANPLLRHAGRNFLKGRLRSHPDVALAYYSDVRVEQHLLAD